MFPLRKRYRNVVANIESVIAWLNNRMRKDDQLVKVSATVNQFLDIPIFFGIMSWVVLCFCVLHGIDDLKNTFTWYPANNFLLIGGAAGIVGGYLACRRDKLVVGWTRDETREKLKEKRLSDPLWIRGEKIKEAVAQFNALVARYDAWYEAVEDEIQNVPADGSDKRYLEFLQKASQGLQHAIDNFNRAVESEKRRDKIREEYPALADGANTTHLTDLLAQLNMPIEFSAEEALHGAEQALEHEEALAMLTAPNADELAGLIDQASTPERVSGGK